MESKKKSEKNSYSQRHVRAKRMEDKILYKAYTSSKVFSG